MNKQILGKIDKGWGYEIVWVNNDDYCGKILIFDRVGAKTSLVFHKERRKSWFVNSGKFKLTYVDTASGEMKTAELEEGKTIDLAELSPHQIEALEANSAIYEVSTPDYVEDRFRLMAGDTQRQPAKQ